MLQDTCLMYDIPVKNVGGESTILLLSVQVFSPQIGETHIDIAGIDIVSLAVSVVWQWLELHSVLII